MSQGVDPQELVDDDEHDGYIANADAGRMGKAVEYLASESVKSSTSNNASTRMGE